MHIVETPVFELAELSDSAKDTAREWYRLNCLDYEWYDCVYEDFEKVCKMLGVTLKTSPVRLYGGGTREKPRLYFSGFWSQGDGASFEGWYRYARGAVRAVLGHAPGDEELHRIANALQEAQKNNFYQLTADIDQRGLGCHEYTMQVFVERGDTWQPPTEGAEENIAEAMRDLARWLYRRLESEYDFLVSNDAVDETIAANAWTFTEDGERFG